MNHERDDQEDEGHDESGTSPLWYLEAFLDDEIFDVFCHLGFLLCWRPELCESVHQNDIARVQCFVCYCRFEESAERLLVVFDQLFFDRFVMLVTMDLEAKCEQDVLEQFYFRVDPL